MNDRVWVYARSHNGKNTSMEYAKQAMKQAEEKGYHVAGYSVDDGSRRTNQRPGLQAAFAALRQGDADVIFVCRLHHVSSSELYLYGFFRHLQKLNAHLVTADYSLPYRMSCLSLGERIRRRAERSGAACPW